MYLRDMHLELMREPYDYSKKLPGELVTPIDDGTTWPDCIKLGEVYEAITGNGDDTSVFISNSQCEILKSGLYSGSWKSCSLVAHSYGHHHWKRAPVAPLTPEEIALAVPLSSKDLSEAMEYFK